MQLYFRLYSPKADLQYPFSIPSVSCYQNMCIISHHRKVNKILPKLQGFWRNLKYTKFQGYLKKPILSSNNLYWFKATILCNEKLLLLRYNEIYSDDYNIMFRKLGEKLYHTWKPCIKGSRWKTCTSFRIPCFFPFWGQ